MVYLYVGHAAWISRLKFLGWHPGLWQGGTKGGAKTSIKRRWKISMTIDDYTLCRMSKILSRSEVRLTGPNITKLIHSDTK